MHWRLAAGAATVGAIVGAGGRVFGIEAALVGLFVLTAVVVGVFQQTLP